VEGQRFAGPNGAQSNSRQASNYTENSDGEQMGIREEKRKVDFHAKSFFGAFHGCGACEFLHQNFPLGGYEKGAL